ncbi:MAG TPA: ATP-dependent Clp protease adaptor ClpS [Armatimonadota bacterium]|nr:ATP-dependent Clp protease adaptor ClpS [Armatimonadota bacterium]
MTVETIPVTRPAQDQAVGTGIDSQFDRLYNVVLLDDNAHSYAYVIDMLQTLLGCPVSWAFEMAVEVDTTGRVIIDSTGHEEALEMQRKIQSFGADWRIPGCMGSMTAIVEPVL